MTYILEIFGHNNVREVIANVMEVSFRDHEHKAGVGIATVRRFKGLERRSAGYRQGKDYTTTQQLEIIAHTDYEVAVKAISRRNDGTIITEWSPTPLSKSASVRLDWHLRRMLYDSPRYAPPYARIAAEPLPDFYEPESAGASPTKRVNVSRDWLNRVAVAFQKVSNGKASEVRADRFAEGIRYLLTQKSK